ncbi:FkbM family methyltransferase, partial [Escherichia coli]|uniref:FkbM family methyltransferase n=1 Tax=Escherichia coli TaxID=562 RepID=UPI003754AD66
TYVDVGAADPEEHSVTHAFYTRGWSGINIEPSQEHFERLVSARTRDLNLKVACAREAGLSTLHAIAGTGLSTLDSSIA